ncbi:hypothetical protein NMG60_11036933 [Bertholletia excelsa]
MSVRRSFEAWEEGFTDLIHSHITPPSFPWPNTPTAKIFDVEFPAQSFVKGDFKLGTDSGVSGVSAIFDIGNKLGQPGAEFWACLMVWFSSSLGGCPQRIEAGTAMPEDLSLLAERFRDFGCADNEISSDGSMDEEMSAFNLKLAGLFSRSQGTINVSSTYDSRTHDVEGSLVARGDLWRIEASRGSSINVHSSLFLIQLGPLLFICDSTPLLPVHISKQHLLWYGYDRKSQIHSICPTVWSKRRRWLLMSMIYLNPLACSFLDLHFPNGQLTHVSGEGLSTSAFLPFCGGLLQAQGQYPGEMKFSFSCKNKWGTCIAPTVQWPDKLFTLSLTQALAWKRSGLLVRPTVQFSMCPTLGGRDPGLKAEFIHSVNEELSLICGCSLKSHPSAFASLSVSHF